MEDLKSRVAKHGVEIEELKRRISLSEENDKTMETLAITNERLSLMVDMNTRQMDKIAETLGNVNENLVSLNHDVRDMRDDMVNIDKRVGTMEKERVKKLEIRQERNSNRTWTIISGVIVGVLTAAALLYFGLK